MWRHRCTKRVWEEIGGTCRGDWTGSTGKNITVTPSGEKDKIVLYAIWFLRVCDKLSGETGIKV